MARAKMPDRVATDCKCYESCLSVAVGGPRGKRPKAFDRAQVTGEEDVLYGRGIASRCDPIYEERGRSLLSVRSKLRALEILLKVCWARIAFTAKGGG